MFFHDLLKKIAFFGNFLGKFAYFHKIRICLCIIFLTKFTLFSAIFWQNSHFFSQFFDKTHFSCFFSKIHIFCFASLWQNLWLKEINSQFFVKIRELFHEFSKKFSPFCDFSKICIGFYNFRLNSHLLSWFFSETYIFLRHLLQKWHCFTILWKIQILSQFFDEISFFSSIFWRNLYFFCNFFTKLPFLTIFSFFSLILWQNSHFFWDSFTKLMIFDNIHIYLYIYFRDSLMKYMFFSDLLIIFAFLSAIFFCNFFEKNLFTLWFFD